MQEMRTMRTEATLNPTCGHFGFSCRQGILPDLSNSDCLPDRAGGTPVGIAALPQPRDAKFDGSGAGLPIALTVAVAMCETVGGTGTVRSTGEALDLQFHQALGAEADHLAQEVGVGGLLQQATEVHGVVGHCRVLGWR